MGRTWAGIALIAGGSFLATRKEETCIPDVVTAGISIPGRCGLDKRWSKRTGCCWSRDEHSRSLTGNDLV